jgi:hypothetical protein
MYYELDQLKKQESSLMKCIDTGSDTFIIGMKGLEYLHKQGSYQKVLYPLYVTAQWAQDFLCNPHPELGRRGAVCPYTRPSIDKELFWLSLYPGSTTAPSKIRELMLTYRDIFQQLPPTEGKETQFKTILVVFPHFSQQACNELIDNVQLQLKAGFISQGLMIGQFHAACPQGGLWNENFKPLRSPLPMLVIRHMVVSDFPFLEHDPGMVQSWMGLFPDTYESYLNKYRSVYKITA